MNATSTKRRKLYYDLSASSEASSITVTTIIPFCASTGAHFGSASADRYGNVMEPNHFAGVATSPAAIQRRCRQAIGAWFEFGVCTGIVKVPRVDFVKAGGSATQTGIDPTTELRPRVRVTLKIGTGGGSVRGTLYIQRQHSIEI